MFFACFLEKNYVFSAFFDAKSAHFKSKKWCQGVPKIEFFSTSILYSFLVLRAPLKVIFFFGSCLGTTNVFSENFFLAVRAILTKKTAFLCIFDDF